MNGTSSFQRMKDTPMLQRTPEWFAGVAALFLATGATHAETVPMPRFKSMKKVLLSGIAVLLLATGTTHACED